MMEERLCYQRFPAKYYRNMGSLLVGMVGDILELLAEPRPLRQWLLFLLFILVVHPASLMPWSLAQRQFHLQRPRLGCAPVLFQF